MRLTIDGGNMKKKSGYYINDDKLFVVFPDGHIQPEFDATITLLETFNVNVEGYYLLKTEHTSTPTYFLLTQSGEVSLRGAKDLDSKMAAVPYGQFICIKAKEPYTSKTRAELLRFEVLMDLSESFYSYLGDRIGAL